MCYLVHPRLLFSFVGFTILPHLAPLASPAVTSRVFLSPTGGFLPSLAILPAQPHDQITYHFQHPLPAQEVLRSPSFNGPKYPFQALNTSLRLPLQPPSATLFLPLSRHTQLVNNPSRGVVPALHYHLHQHCACV